MFDLVCEQEHDDWGNYGGSTRVMETFTTHAKAKAAAKTWFTDQWDDSCFVSYWTHDKKLGDFPAFLRTRHINIMEQNVDSSAEAYRATGHDHAGQNVETVTVQEVTPFAEGKAGRGKGKRSAGTVKTPTKRP